MRAELPRETAEAINADDDRLKANKRYAWLGLTTDLPFTTLALNGPDTASVRTSTTSSGGLASFQT